MSEAWTYTLVPFVLAVALIAILRRSRWSARLVDHPNERSLHRHPTPRVGGVGIALACLPFVAAAGLPAGPAIVACTGFLVVISAIDDARSLPVEVRLPAHLAAAVIALLSFGGAYIPSYGWSAAAFLILGMVWMTNLYNFMDGSDGLAGGMAVIGFGAFAFAAYRGGFTPLLLASLAVAAAAAGFLLHNFPPARVFLGDAGSIPLGFLAFIVGLQGLLLGAWPIWFPVLVFSPFVVDATVTLLRRLFAGKRIALAHREHAYQRLVLAGWSARRLALTAYALMLATSASAMVGLGADRATRYAIIAAWVTIYAAMLLVIERYTRDTRAAP